MWIEILPGVWWFDRTAQTEPEPSWLIDASDLPY